MKNEDNKRRLIIVRLHTILHFDEHPILLIGFNDRNQIIIGSLLHENDEDKISYLYSIVPIGLALNFLNRSTSYLNLLKQVGNIFIVTKDYNENIINIEETVISNLAPEILPLSTAYCPIIDNAIISQFGRGFYTDLNQKPRIKQINNDISHYLADLNDNEIFLQKKPIRKNFYLQKQSQAEQYTSNRSHVNYSEANINPKYLLEHA